jgi:mannose-6-phosphate isomerase
MWDKVVPKNWRRPLLLRPDNFTPPARTPWGGRRIVDRLKAGAGLQVEGPVGEAWELSVEPDFPSRLAEGPLLEEVLRWDRTLLGEEADLGSTALLVKIVDAKDDLSVQIHPRDDDAALGTDESGKPEAWYIIEAEPGSGLYLGFKEGVSRVDVEAALDEGRAVDALMHFVEVFPGDVFAIEPGTAHAIGKGVLLLEPQRVAPGKRSITYRYWDWNRRYDAKGQPDPNGKPRALHRKRALDVTNWDGPREQRLIDRIRYRAGPASSSGAASLEVLASRGGPLRSGVFSLQRLTGSGSLELHTDDHLRALTVLAGTLSLRCGRDRVEVCGGQTAALPASLGPLGVELSDAHALLCGLA